MSTDGADEVKERAPAAPEANAKTMYIRPTLVRDDISRKDGSTGKKMPIVRDRKTAKEMPMTMVLSELLAMARSPKVVARDKEIFGVSMGAITMATIITATLLLRTPIAATIEERIIIET
jgi:hypothetical protein